MQPGDAVVIGGYGQHVETVRGFSGSTTLTYGGNTSAGSSGSQSNGGGAYARTRCPSEVRGLRARGLLVNGDRWSWHGAVALTLAIGVVAVMVLIAGPWDPDPISDQGANVLLTIIGALAAYLGFTVGGEVNGRGIGQADPSQALRTAYTASAPEANPQIARLGRRARQR